MLAPSKVEILARKLTMKANFIISPFNYMLKKLLISYNINANEKSVILLQNVFSTLEKYIDYPHTINGAPVRLANNLKDEILEIFNSLLALKNKV